MDQKSVTEINELGKAFEKMTQSLSESMDELHKKIEELDISKNEKAKALRLLDNIIDSMPSVLIGIDEEYKVIMWNMEAEKLTDIKADEIINNDLFTFTKRLFRKV